MSDLSKRKIYHIVHTDRLPSIVADDYLWSDARVAMHMQAGTTIGMSRIKQRRLNELRLTSHPDLHVGDCVPFYFCPRSIMLYTIHKANDPDLVYRGGQDAIVHLEADLRRTVSWAESHGQQWAFTLSNAGTYYFVDHSDLAQLSEIDWYAVAARDWRRCKAGKQAEFLIQERFPWALVARIGVRSQRIHDQVNAILQKTVHRPPVEVRPDWYY